MRAIAYPRITAVYSVHETGVLYRYLYVTAVSLGVADPVIDLPSPPATPGLAPERMNLLRYFAQNAQIGFDIHVSFKNYSEESSVTYITAIGTIIYQGLGIHHFDELRFLTPILSVREFVLQDSNVESSALKKQFRDHPIAKFTLRNVKLYTLLAFGHLVSCPWKGHVEEMAGSTFVDSVLLEDLWTPSYFENVDVDLSQQPKVKHFEVNDQWSVQFGLGRLLVETEW